MADTKKKNSGTKKSSASKSKVRSKKLTAEEKAAAKALEEKAKQDYKKEQQIKSEAVAILIIALGVFFVLSMLTNACGLVGENVKTILTGLIGKVAYVMPFFLIILGVLIFAEKTALISIRSTICTVLLFVFLSALFAAFVWPLSDNIVKLKEIEFAKVYAEGAKSGGVVGVFIGCSLINLLGKVGLFIVCIVGIIIMLAFIAETPLSSFFDYLKVRQEAIKQARIEKEEAREAERLKAEVAAEQAKAAEANEKLSETIVKEALPELHAGKLVTDNTLPELNVSAAFASSDSLAKTEEFSFEAETPKHPVVHEYEGEDITENKKRILDYVADDEKYGLTGGEYDEYGNERVDVLEKYASKTIAPGTSDADALSKEIEESLAVLDKKSEEVSDALGSAKPRPYRFPPLNLLNKPGNGSSSRSSGDTYEQAALLERTLSSFGVSAKVLDVVKGPAVTRFEVQPAPGVQVSKIVHLQDDIALNLRAKSIRIEAPIPGKAAVGIEASNDTTQTVLLRELVDSKEFKSHKSKIAVTLGKSISGENIVCDLHEMPHLLIAGTTGSGKSVCIDSMLVSLLYHAKPEEVKLILIDPKIVELAPFNGIPHLLIPVVTEPNKASMALGWAVGEMDNRYNMFAEEGVKDLQGYNESVRFKGEADRVLPEIVIVIDELADLIMASKNQVEDSICRLAQKARAAGMHLVIATQRPSTDVITGVIKANVPSKIALSVSSSIDSRVILDMNGAENLLGKGDMLYSPQSLSKPIRVQGTFISDNELHAVIDYVKNQSSEVSYNAEIMNAMDKVGSNNVSDDGGNDDGDELFMDCLEAVVRSQQCTISMLQRRFRIGYNRSARLVDMMEERGMVGPADGSHPRKVLMTEEEFDEYVRRTNEL